MTSQYFNIKIDVLEYGESKFWNRESNIEKKYELDITEQARN
jgi:hypothetical protein